VNDDICELKINGNMINNAQGIVDFFNSYFLTIVDNNLKNTSSANNNNPLDYLQQAFHCPFPHVKHQAVTSTEIAKIIQSLKNKDSHGYDEISVRLLKASYPFIISPLTHMCNKMLLSGNSPDRSKYAEVKPLFKNGDKTDPSNYRPISILTSFSKTFEKIIYRRLYKRICENNNLTNEQFGFRPQSPTINASFSLINEILEAVNKNNSWWNFFVI
jgi:hypothetical protein